MKLIYLIKLMHSAFYFESRPESNHSFSIWSQIQMPNKGSMSISIQIKNIIYKRKILAWIHHSFHPRFDPSAKKKNDK